MLYFCACFGAIILIAIVAALLVYGIMYLYYFLKETIDESRRRFIRDEIESYFEEGGSNE